jgi:phage gp16-like protein
MTAAMEKRRRAEIAKIHLLAKKRAGMDDHTYRAFLMRETGKSSAAELDQAERSKVLDTLKTAGFVEGASRIAKLDDFDEREPQTKLIRCLWADLTAMGVLADSSERALQRFIRQTAGVDHIRWLGPHESNRSIAGLKSWLQRERERRQGRRKA